MKIRSISWFAKLFILGHGGIGGAHGSQNANATLSAVRLKLRPFFVEHIPVVVSSVCKKYKEVILPIKYNFWPKIKRLIQ